jgi:uncharacterized membrane protein YfcA
VISTADTLALVAAGAAAGVVGSAGGITSMISYPALLAAGLAPLQAAVANNVALVACWPGSALGSRPELVRRRGWVARWAPVAGGGGALGAALLLSTPPGAFARVVPFLVALGALALALEPRLGPLRRRGARRPRRRLALVAWLVPISTYNGYFGAGSGIMTLALMLAQVDRDLPRANALKNMLIGAASLGAAVAFVIAGRVQWPAVAPLAAGMFAGSAFGPVLVRRLPASALRWLIVLLGLALAVALWLDPRL